MLFSSSPKICVLFLRRNKIYITMITLTCIVRKLFFKILIQQLWTLAIYCFDKETERSCPVILCKWGNKMFLDILITIMAALGKMRKWVRTSPLFEASSQVWLKLPEQSLENLRWPRSAWMRKKETLQATDWRKKCCYISILFNTVVTKKQREWSLSLWHVLRFSHWLWESY